MSLNISTVFEHNGAKYEFDIRDAEHADLYEKACEKIKEVEKKIPKDGKASTMIAAQCKMIKSFFDTCLGNGAGEAICTDRNNISICYEAYEKFIIFVTAQKDDIITAKNTFAKYSNREQRRAAAKPKK